MRLVYPVRLAALLVLGMFSLGTRPAQAQDSGATSASGKGIVGGGLLGAEAVMLTEALLQVKPGWAYIVGGGAGGVAGGVGGYFAEQQDTKLSLCLLAGGFVLVIPTTVAVLSATAYEPPQDYTQDRSPTDEPVAEPARENSETQAPGAQPPGASAPQAPTESSGSSPASAPGATSPARPPTAGAPQSLLRPVLPPPALVGFKQGALSLGFPAVEIAPTFSRREIAIFGVEQRAEIRFPLFIAAF